MMRQATNTVNNLIGIENSVYSSGKIVLATHAEGKRGSATRAWRRLRELRQFRSDLTLLLTFPFGVLVISEQFLGGKTVFRFWLALMYVFIKNW